MGSFVQGDEVEVPVYESGAEVLQKAQEKWSVAPPPYPAMYSSVLGGIILDPAMMVVPIDDHMVHRGHGVFDTAMILDGALYELDAHLDRFLRSAAAARVVATPPFPRHALRSILIQMTAASGCRRGSIRYWLSSGPGDFLLSSRGCPTPAFYAVVIASEYEQCGRDGVRAVTATVPMKPPQFATMKNVNYLPNVLSIMDAEDRGAFASVWVDDEGYVAEGPMVNVAFVTPDNHLVLPAFDKILGGCTAKRMLALAPRLVESGLLAGVSTRNITVEDAKGSVEMAFVGSGLPVLPVVHWDDKPIGDGTTARLGR
ncbi:D-amino-acid transaminase, chloroplastic isoform X2 [Sorghum bicolor]|uniref:D-amino-acid transaminase, chloroplastic isoform X2 n=1 Tax=Sorghum bicolor TaxID=4558 RepID=UPI000B424114|nr:D-amino-acid transaminase, chloroplastic isoform X2 [Sorghum bicolor]|eukprot:XP_021312299.1 D-amino-acid transaminase, chloroplastic isoform X2 [Sorghum bicolor]